IIVVGGYFLTRLPVFQIDSVELNNINNQEIIDQLNTLKGKSIISSATAVTIEKIRESSVEVIDIHCDKGIPNKLRCTAELRAPVFIWQSSQKDYFIDKVGVAYRSVSSSGDLTIIEDRKKLPVKIGEQVMSEEMVNIYQSITETLSEKKIVISNFFIDISPFHPGVVASKRLDKLPFPAKPIEILYSSSYPVSIQTQLLSQTLENKSSKITKYIDLRTPGYIYYK
ncbi:MAG: hypothetical protein WD544_00180, partial [Patescibacteria group bacterium]